MIYVIPAINETNPQSFQAKLRIAEKLSTLIHIDIGDGKFVKHETIPLTLLQDATRNPLAIHYMGRSPFKQIENLPKNTHQFIFHYETSPRKTADIIKKCAELDIKPVIAIRPKTAVSTISAHLHENVGVHVLTVEPGKSGQELMTWCLGKVREIKDINPKIIVSVDGGVNTSTAPLVKLYPADSVAVSSAIFASKNPERAFKDLERALN